VTDLCEPLLERFGFWRRYRLYYPEQSFDIRAVGSILFTVRCSHFQSSTNCRQLKSILAFDAYFHLEPIITRINAVRQSSDNVGHGEVPRLRSFVILSADLIFFERHKGLIIIHYLSPSKYYLETIPTLIILSPRVILSTTFISFSLTLPKTV